MSELQQALQEIRAKQPQQKNVELKSALQKIRSQAQAPTEQPQQEGFLKSTARGIAESFGRTAVSGVKAGLGAIELGKLGFGKLTGDVKAEQKFIDRAEDIQQPTNLPFIGETKPVTTPKESVGVGLQVGSFFGGGGVATSAGKALLGGLVRKGASTFAKVGALGGGAIAGGEALEDDESISNVLIKTAIGTATGGIFGGITGGATPLISKAFSKTTSALTKRATQKASQEIDDLIKNIGGATKLSKADIIPLRKAISDVEVRGVDTAQKAVSTFKTRIQALGNKINEVLDTDKRVYSFANLSKQGKNYINEGLEQLQKFYESTNNEQKLNFVKAMRNKLQTQGLTLKEVNIIAQVHGFDLKGFNVLTGELASGLKKQASENTRKGIKNTIQRLFKNPIFSEADSQLSNVLRARDLFTQFAKSVFDKEKKMLDATSVQKFRQVATEAIDVMTGRMMSTILSFSRNRGSNTANALDIEKVLQKMLLKVKRIDNLPPNRIIPRLQSIIDEPAPPALLQLEAPKTIPLPPKPDTSGIITPKKPGGLFEFQEFRKKQFQSIGIQPKKKSNIIESLKKTTPKKTIPKQISKDLATEARKFKSAEEFVEKAGKIEVQYDWKYLDEMKADKAKGLAISQSDFNSLSKLEKEFRGTGRSETFYRAGVIGKNGDVWLTPSKSGAEQYAKSGGTKVGEYKVLTQRPLILKDNADISKIIKQDISETNFVNDPELKQVVIDYAKKNEYDSVMFPDSFPDGYGGMDSLVIFDKDITKTKSQLTDIYQKAVAEKQIIPESAKLKGDDLIMKPKVVEPTISKELEPLATEARKFDTVNEFYERMPSKIRDEFRNKGIKGKEQIEKWWKDNNIPTKKDTLAGAMQHRPSKSGVASNIPQDILPDFYDRPNLYTFGGKEYDESVSILQKIKGKPESTVTIYRASPKNELRTGDWITFSKEKARIESLSENVPVQSFKVKVKDVQFAGDDITEFGYWGNKISDQAKGAK